MGCFNFFSKGVGFIVVYGRDVRFWLDDWVEVGHLGFCSSCVKTDVQKESSDRV